MSESVSVTADIHASAELEELRLSMVNGDEIAARSLFDALRPAVYQAVDKYAPYGMVDDLVCDGLSKVLSKMSDPERYTAQNPLGFAYRVAANNTLDYLRQRSRQNRVFVSLDDKPERYDYCHPANDDVAQDALGSGGAATAQRLLEDAGLDSTQTEALTMLSEGYTYDEIAAAQDVPLGTVRSRISRARGKAQRYIVNRGLDPRSPIEEIFEAGDQ